MTVVGWLPADVEELFGPDATAEESYEVLTVDVPPASWITALETARDRLGCTYFDWLSAVDEPGTGFHVSAHVAALSPVRRLLLRTTVPHDAPALPSAVGVYAGAAWHERETHEMFGVTFEGHPALDHLLLPENFEGHPLRKDFVLAARVAKAWPGAKEPGEPEHGGPKRRQMLPPGVPDPNEWGPLKGQLPPAPTRPARGPARAAGDRPVRAAGDRPVRRTRSASEGSASQAPASGETATPSPSVPRRTRSASEGSASQSAPGESTSAAPSGPRRTRTAAEGSAGQTSRAAEPPSPEGGSPAPGSEPAAPGPASPRRARSASEGSTSQRAASDRAGTEPGRPSRAPRSTDAPWHHARPAYDEQSPPTDAEPADSDVPADPTADSDVPTDTTNPTGPNKPTDPTDPANPTGPTDPANPTGPTDPATPKPPTDSPESTGGPQ
ncbi:NADH-quinone oxidoreductase subunit C [Streptomyces sp. NPDC085931]|uniref:NADH-quinone oxidoreductase subunit C n=1 Tax=Streptomyces sp. NPDC085931 TaxID=3365740 RepID=UPI0037D92989